MRLRVPRTITALVMHRCRSEDAVHLAPRALLCGGRRKPAPFSQLGAARKCFFRDQPTSDFRITRPKIDSCCVSAPLKENSSGHSSLLTCFEGESLAMLVSNLFTAASYLRLLLRYCVLVLWRKLVRRASFLLRRVCVSFFAQVSSYFGRVFIFRIK